MFVWNDDEIAHLIIDPIFCWIRKWFEQDEIMLYMYAITATRENISGSTVWGISENHNNMSAEMTNCTGWVQYVENNKKLLLGVMWYGET